MRDSGAQFPEGSCALRILDPDVEWAAFTDPFTPKLKEYILPTF